MRTVLDSRNWGVGRGGDSYPYSRGGVLHRAAATGALSPQVLALKIEVYDPVTHYQQVRDVWGRRAHPRRTLMRS